MMWSFDPKKVDMDTISQSKDSCFKLNSDGRWELANCQEQLPVACFSQQNRNWKTTGPVTFAEADSACQLLGEDYRFRAPVNPWQNKWLKEVAQGQQTYIDVKKLVSGQWVVNQHNLY